MTIKDLMQIETFICVQYILFMTKIPIFDDTKMLKPK